MFDLDYNGCELYFVISEEHRSDRNERRKKFLHAFTFCFCCKRLANSNPVVRMVYIVGHD